jgi:hypothetical protein
MNLTDTIVAAIAADTALASWCTTTFSTSFTVQSGIDLDRLPDQDEYPIVMVAEVSAREGKNISQESADYVITCGIIDDAEPTVTGKIKTFRQVAELAAFRKLVLTAVESAYFLGGYVAEVEVENDPVEMFPIFSTNMVVRIHCPTVMRGRWVK